MLEIRHLRSLVAIRDVGSLSAAAPLLQLTQSALSHQLKALESHLGTPLFIRNQRPLRPTPAGERLIRLAEEVLAAVAAAEDAIRRKADDAATRLYMAVECDCFLQWLTPMLELFRSTWPHIELDFPAGAASKPLHAVLCGDADLAVTADPRENRDGLRLMPLFRYQVQLLLPSDHRLACKPFIEATDLAGETLISHPVCRDKVDVFRRFLNMAGTRPAAVRVTEQTPLLVQLVASGRGVAALPSWVVAEFLPNMRLTALPLGQKGLWSTLYASVREEDAELPHVQAFVNLVQATISPRPPEIEATVSASRPLQCPPV